MMRLRFNLIILFIIRTATSANEDINIESNHDTKVELEIPVEIINNYLLKYFSNKKVFLSFLMQASEQMEHEKQTEIINKLYIKTVHTHFSHMRVDVKNSLTLRIQHPFLLILIDGISSFA